MRPTTVQNPTDAVYCLFMKLRCLMHLQRIPLAYVRAKYVTEWGAATALSYNNGSHDGKSCTSYGVQLFLVLGDQACNLPSSQFGTIPQSAGFGSYDPIDWGASKEHIRLVVTFDEVGRRRLRL